MTLPNLVIAGVTKAGTTSLFHYLAQHPDIGPADVKEVDHYAPMTWGEEPPSLDAYAAHFRNCADSRWRLEASPRYFIGGPALVQRLAAELDSPRVLITLREPVSRMWSSYTYKRSKGRLPEGMGFAAFVDGCEQVVERGIQHTSDDAMFRTLASGVYADYLGDWFEVLGEAVRVVFFDDLVAAPQRELAALCRWLDLDPGPVDDIETEARNATVQPRSLAVRRTAYRMNRRLKRVLGTDSAIKARLRTAYHKINVGSATLEFPPDQRERLRAFYAPTLPPLRAQLAAHGVTALPEWLTA